MNVVTFCFPQNWKPFENSIVIECQVYLEKVLTCNVAIIVALRKDGEDHVKMKGLITHYSKSTGQRLQHLFVQNVIICFNAVGHVTGTILIILNSGSQGKFLCM
jgi:hypothetical protein